MRKGIKIKKVIITGRDVKAIDQNDNEIKITRSERNILMDYEDECYIALIKKMYANTKVLDENFSVVKDGEEVFHI